MSCTAAELNRQHEDLKRQFDLKESLDQASRNLVDRLDTIEQSIKLLGIGTESVATTQLTGAMSTKDQWTMRRLGIETDHATPYPDFDDKGHVFVVQGFVELVLGRLDAIEKRLGMHV